MIYVSLHTHTTFSFGDGYGTVKEHVSRVKDLGMNAVAFTEHGNTSSQVQLEQEANKAGIKPIYGCEIYVAPVNQPRKCHMILLASTQQGLRNLNKIVTESWKTLGDTAKSKFPTVHWPILKEYNEGIIALSGCSDSQLSCSLLGGKSYGDKRLEYTEDDFQRTARAIRKYQAVFSDRYYLEVQRFPGLERTCVLNPAYERLSNDTGALLVATADVHYPYPDQNAIQKILHASHRSGSIETTEQGWEYDIRLTYPESDKQIYNDLRNTGLSKDAAKQAIENTAIIAERC